MYTAIVLDEKSVGILKNISRQLDLEGFVYETPQGEPLPHHMTINLGPLDKSLNNPKILGKKAKLVVDGLWFSREIRACAARVIYAHCGDDEIQSFNEQSHVTICLLPPAKPVQSNDLFDSDLCILDDPHFIDHPVVLQGEVREVE